MIPFKALQLSCRRSDLALEFTRHGVPLSRHKQIPSTTHSCHASPAKKWRKKYGPLLLDAEAASLRYGRGSGANDSCPTKENPPANENKPAENLSAKESLASKENPTAKENPHRLLTPSQPPRRMLASQDSSLARDFANAREYL